MDFATIRVAGVQWYEAHEIVGARTRARLPRGAYYVLCVNNTGYPSSLDVRKIYVALPDPDAARHSQVRVVDESGEDYLFPRRYFIDVPLSRSARRALSPARS